MKPFIKWVGGKSQLLDEILPKINEIKDKQIYLEPFLGGGAVFIEILKNNLYDEYHLNDINPFLINLYSDIKLNLSQLCKELENLEIEYIESDEKEKFYYLKRDEYNENNDLNTRKSALFVFLNKTGFRGLYRESKNGFNVPYGNYKNPLILNKSLLESLSVQFNEKKVFFYNLDFETFLGKFFKNDKKITIYADPPYYPLNKKSFTEYTKSGFADKHIILSEVLDKIEGFILISNSYCEMNINLYKKFNHKILEAKRKINSKKPNEITKEILFYNF